MEGGTQGDQKAEEVIQGDSGTERGIQRDIEEKRIDTLERAEQKERHKR